MYSNVPRGIFCNLNFQFLGELHKFFGVVVVDWCYLHMEWMYPCMKLWQQPYLPILTGKDWCFTQFSTGMAVWLLLIFLICLHNQLSSIHSIISTEVWKMWFDKYTVKWMVAPFSKFYGKIWVSLNIFSTLTLKQIF